MKREKKKEGIAILDFGSQYTQLIARRIREAKVYSEILPYYVNLDKIREDPPDGIILSGGPSSVYKDHAPLCDKKIFELGIPNIRNLLWCPVDCPDFWGESSKNFSSRTWQD